MDKIEIMNLGLSDKEFCHRLWQENPDPVVTRLLSIVAETAEWRGSMEEFDEPWEVSHTLTELRNEADYLNEQLIEVNDRLRKLEARTVIELIAELRMTISDKYDENERLIREIDRANQSHANMESKLNMWAVLNK